MALCKTEGLAIGFSKALDTRRAVYISDEVKGAYPKLVQLICDMCESEKNSWTLVDNKTAFQTAKTKASGFPSQSSKAGFLLCQVLNHGPPCAQQHSDRGGEKLAKTNQNEGEAPRSNQDTNTHTQTLPSTPGPPKQAQKASMKTFSLSPIFCIYFLSFAIICTVVLISSLLSLLPL